MSSYPSESLGTELHRGFSLGNSHPAASPARLFSPKESHYAFGTRKAHAAERLAQVGFTKVCSGMKVGIGKALPVRNVEIIDIIILINFPRPVFSAFIICREKALNNRASLFGSPAWG